MEQSFDMTTEHKEELIHLIKEYTYRSVVVRTMNIIQFGEEESVKERDKAWRKLRKFINEL
jgi:hypothetical protein